MVGANALEVVESRPHGRRPRSPWAGEALAGFETHLAGRGDLADNSRDTYMERVADWLAWLESTDHPDALTESLARDRAVLAYRDHLLVERQLTVGTTKLALAAIDAFFKWRGLGPAAVARPRWRHPGLRTLDVGEQRALLRAAAARGHRDHAVIGLMLSNGLTVSECQLLADDEVHLTVDAGHMQIRSLDGQMRTAALANSTRQLIEAWRIERRAMLRGRRRRALFLSERMTPMLSATTIDRIVRSTGREAGLVPDISPGTLRWTFQAQVLEVGIEPALVATVMGLVRPNADHLRALAQPLDPATTKRVVEAMAVPATTGRGPNTLFQVRAASRIEQLEFEM